MFFGEEVPALHGLAMSVGCPATPKAQRSPVVLVPRCQAAGAAPKRQKGTRDASACLPVGLIVDPVQVGRSSVLLANRVNMSGIAQRVDVGMPEGRGENLWWSAPVGQRVVYYGVGCGQDQSLWERRRLGEQGERPKGKRKPGICAIPHLPGRHYVKHGRSGNPPCDNECLDVENACVRYNRMLGTMLVNRAPLTCPGDVQKACYRTYQRCYLAQECDKGNSFDEACLRECGGLLKSCYRAGCGTQ